MLVKHLGMADYLATWQAMQTFTANRTAETPDELWILQHPPVYTMGLNGKPEHLPQNVQIPVVKIDRGGQITYHGPGQIVAYLLIDLKRKGIGVRELVTAMEQSVKALLSSYHIQSENLQNAPGVYVDGKKIAALGLRIKHGCSYHGLSLNVDMDLSPFLAINPCGYPGLEVTQTSELGIGDSIDLITTRLVSAIEQTLG
ncbi:lipoyl(octanoyl) transferase LipB [Sulfurirhabdus autotrophica]|uniref:Octanoyltransferase n=1 Tax=Sulfurirhabdus autotrophica TaxID=1706046 RepID=A0A4V2W2I6_9PROT|nr:lipoyl(octanoyl) transferase LipB [Sulfurirhabdus autotrophica]TCV88169.1 lipoyl(octanoyl) transferase [Sulfurirhabdus autotrophica]